MDDPAEWAKFRADMVAGGHVTNAATAMELMKRAAKAQDESDEEANEQKTSRSGDDDQDVLEAEEVLGDDDEEEVSHEQQNIVNKGLRWINQTLSATSRMQEASASQLYAPQLKLSPNRRSVPPRFSFDGSGTPLAMLNPIRSLLHWQKSLVMVIWLGIALQSTEALAVTARAAQPVPTA